MDCPHKILPTGIPAHITRHTEIATPDPAIDTTEKIKKQETGPDHNPDIAEIVAQAIITCTEAVPYHNNWMDTAAIEAAQDDPIQHTEDTVADLTMTHHTGHTTNHPHTAAHQDTTFRTAVDHIHAHPTDH